MVGWLDLPGFLCEQRNARGGRFGNVRHGVTDLASKQPARGKVVYRLQNVLVVECAFGRPLCGVGVLGNDARHLTHVALGLDVESYQLPVTSVFPPNLCQMFGTPCLVAKTERDRKVLAFVSRGHR